MNGKSTNSVQLTRENEALLEKAKARSEKKQVLPALMMIF
jgi:hypothetical protein